MTQDPQNTVPPAAQVLGMASGYMISRAVGVAAQLGIADLLSGGGRSAAELAVATETNADALYRTLRALASVGVFADTGGRIFVNTPLSETLRRDVPGSIRDMALFICDEMHCKVYAEFGYSVHTGKPAFDHVYGQPPFAWLQQNAAEGKAFDDAMASHSGMDAQAIAAACPFEDSDVVADIGGGNGMLLATVLAKYPGTRGILYDLPHSIGHAKQAGMLPAERCELVAGDFFESAPPGANVYMMKHIIHDWDDERSVRILKNIRAVLPVGGKVRIAELMMPPGNEPGFAKILDLEMLVIPAGRERTTTEYGQLMEAAGLRLERVIPTQSPLGVFEGVAA